MKKLIMICLFLVSKLCFGQLPVHEKLPVANTIMDRLIQSTIKDYDYRITTDDNSEYGFKQHWQTNFTFRNPKTLLIMIGADSAKNVMFIEFVADSASRSMIEEMVDLKEWKYHGLKTYENNFLIDTARYYKVHEYYGSFKYDTMILDRGPFVYTLLPKVKIDE